MSYGFRPSCGVDWLILAGNTRYPVRFSIAARRAFRDCGKPGKICCLRCDRAEIQHDQTLEILGRKLDQSMAQFEALDLTLNNPDAQMSRTEPTAPSGDGGRVGGGNVAVQTGEKLAELDRKRRKAQDAGF